MNQNLRTDFTVIVLLCGAIGCGFARGASTETFNGPALKINTQIVSIREVETVFSDSYVLIQDKLRRGELSQANLENAIRMAWAEALDTATQDKIMDQRADKRRKDIIKYYIDRAGGQIGPDRALEFFKREEADYIRRLRKEMVAAAGGEEELRAALKRRGQTMENWEAGLSRELFRRDVLAMELGPISRSPGAARGYYEKHPELFKQEEAWRLRRIRVAKSKFTSADVALQAAKMVREKIVAGGDFAELAARVSEDPEFAEKGGLLMRDGKTDLPSGFFPAEEKIAETLKDGGISDVLDSGDWYVIIQRVGYRPIKVQSFDEAAERAEALSFNEKLKQKKKELFEKLKDESYIEVLQKDPPENLMKNVPSAAGSFVTPK